MLERAVGSGGGGRERQRLRLLRDFHFLSRQVVEESS
jgi:hypothetical protein